MKRAESMLRCIVAGLLVLALLGGAGLAGSASNGDAFVGNWLEPMGGRARLTIERVDDHFDIFVYWSGGAAYHSEWSMTGTYDAESNAIVCRDCRCVNVEYDWDGNAHEEVAYTGGGAKFTHLNGVILWDDFQEDIAADIMFVKYDGEF